MIKIEKISNLVEKYAGLYREDCPEHMKGIKEEAEVFLNKMFSAVNKALEGERNNELNEIFFYGVKQEDRKTIIAQEGFFKSKFGVRKGKEVFFNANEYASMLYYLCKIVKKVSKEVFEDVGVKYTLKKCHMNKWNFSYSNFKFTPKKIDLCDKNEVELLKDPLKTVFSSLSKQGREFRITFTMFNMSGLTCDKFVIIDEKSKEVGDLKIGLTNFDDDDETDDDEQIE